MTDLTKTKQFIPSVTRDDLEDWRGQMSFVRSMMYKGKWPTAKETLVLMEDIYNSMKDQFAVGDGVWV